MDPSTTIQKHACKTKDGVDILAGLQLHMTSAPVHPYLPLVMAHFVSIFSIQNPTIGTEATPPPTLMEHSCLKLGTPIDRNPRFFFEARNFAQEWSSGRMYPTCILFLCVLIGLRKLCCSSRWTKAEKSCSTSRSWSRFPKLFSRERGWRMNKDRVVDIDIGITMGAPSSGIYNWFF